MTLRVVGAGLGRTGTHSLKLALEQLLDGRCYHMSELFEREDDTAAWAAAARGDEVDWPGLLSEFTATVDWPDHGADAEAQQRPHGVLARRAASEIGARRAGSARRDSAARSARTYGLSVPSAPVAPACEQAAPGSVESERMYVAGMIASVSTSSRSSGAPRRSTVVNGCIRPSLRGSADPAGDGGRGRGHRARQMRPAPAHPAGPRNCGSTSTRSARQAARRRR